MTKKQSEASNKRSEYMKQRWQDPEFRRNMKKKFRERNIRLWQDPEYRAKMIKERKKRWLNPAYRKKQSQASRETWKRDEVKEKHSKALKAYWANPQNKQERTELMRIICRTPEFREKISVISTKLWQDPEFRHKTCAALKEIANDPERLRKMSEAMKKKWQNAKYRKKVIGMWNDPEFRKKHTRENCHAWKGGISFEPYPPEFNSQLKKKIKKRDAYTCQHCGTTEKCTITEKGRKLTVHHIDYNKQNNAPHNLITLCNHCNIKANTHRAYWTAYFTQKMLEILPNYSEKRFLIQRALFNNSEKNCRDRTNMG